MRQSIGPKSLSRQRQSPSRAIPLRQAASVACRYRTSIAPVRDRRRLEDLIHAPTAAARAHHATTRSFHDARNMRRAHARGLLPRPRLPSFGRRQCRRHARRGGRAFRRPEVPLFALRIVSARPDWHTTLGPGMGHSMTGTLARIFSRLTHEGARRLICRRQALRHNS
jgi:hypothetical protein